MKSKRLTSSFIEEMIRTKTIEILTTINPDNTHHTTGVLYRVSPPQSKFTLYICKI